MEFVLNDQIRRRQRLGQLLPDTRVRGAVETDCITPIGAPQQHAARTDPGQARELVHRRDHEARDATVERLVDCDDRQRVLAFERARQIATRQLEILRLVGIGHEPERRRFQLGAAPRAAFKGNRRRFATAALIADDLGASSRLVFLPFRAHPVGRRGLPNPQPDFKGPRAQRLRRFLPLQFERADQC